VAPLDGFPRRAGTLLLDHFGPGVPERTRVGRMLDADDAVPPAAIEQLLPDVDEDGVPSLPEPPSEW
jgi:hypothetical protein